MTKRPWRGRVRDRVWKAFIALDGETVPTTELIQRWPRKSKWHPEEYRRVRDAAAELADPIARGPGRGRPRLWRIRAGENIRRGSRGPDNSLRVEDVLP
jgi:hypothetical protein